MAGINPNRQKTGTGKVPATFVYSKEGAGNLLDKFLVPERPGDNHEKFNKKKR